MKCPSCSFEQPDGGECKSCGLIFAKWRGPAASPESLAPGVLGSVEAPPPPAAGGGGKGVVLVAVLAVSGAGGWWALSRPPRVLERIPPPETPPALESAPAWKYYGVVKDLIRLTPVANAAVTFYTDAGERFTAITNPDGSYALEAPATSEKGYSVEIIHGGYAGGDYFDSVEDDYDRYGLDDRVQMYRLRRPIKGYRPREQNFRLNFWLTPSHLSPAEIADIKKQLQAGR